MFKELNTESIILKRMMDKVSNSLDKREGSIVYNALAPVALELAQAYSDLDRYLEYAFVSQSTPDVYIEKRANEIGIKRKQPTKAIKKARFYDNENKLMDIPLNSRFSMDGVNFKAISKIDRGVFAMECEKEGSIGNSLKGTLTPIEYINNLSKGEIDEILEYGLEMETGQELYSRIIEKEQNPTTSGNPNHYKQWALEVKGVGKCKVFPLWNGQGTVKVVIVDDARKSPSQTLIDKVYSYIEDKRPIGPKITVKGAVENKVDVKAKVVLANGFNISKVQEDVTKYINKYLNDIAFEVSYVSIAQIGNIILKTPGVLDYSELKINNLSSNIGLADEEIPVLYTVTLGV